MSALDLTSIFEGMPEYVIMRIPEYFPNYPQHTDIDVLCKDLAACVSYLKSVVSVKAVSVSDTQTHLDHVIGNKLDLKFDLYGFYISDQFKEDVFTYRRKSTIYGVWVPWERHNLASKYYEYRVAHKEKYSRYELYKWILDEYITL